MGQSVDVVAKERNGPHRSARRYFCPSFSSSAMTQSEMQGMPVGGGQKISFKISGDLMCRRSRSPPLHVRTARVPLPPFPTGSSFARTP